MYIPCLDGLRAIAILLVLVAHLVDSRMPWWFSKIFGFWVPGTIGVRLFFLISGFLITYILNNELKKNGKINFKKFFLKRLLRIFPAFYIYLITLGLLSYLDIIIIGPLAIVYSFFYVQNLNFPQNTSLFASSMLVIHSWSLSVEEQFYIFYPFVLYKFKSIFQNHSFKLIILMTLTCSFFRMLNYSFPEISRMTGGVFFMHCDFLLYGGVLSLSLEKVKLYFNRNFYPFRYWFLILAIILLVYSSRVEYYSAINILIFGNLILFSNLYILLFILLFPYSSIGRILEFRIMKVIGILSYSIYVWQQLFLGSTKLWTKFKFLTEFPNNILLVIICATCSYLFIERPFLKLKKKYL
jgi:peptidoglycan/LPS O-acetylase OafA/YrhL